MKIGIAHELTTGIDILQQVLATVSGYRVVWVAKNGLEAVEHCRVLTPDLIIMSPQLPVMNSVEATRKIMLATPCPILLVSPSVTGNSARIFDALGAGALDVVTLPGAGKTGTAPVGDELLKKISLIRKLGGSMPYKSGPNGPVCAKTSSGSRMVNLVVLGCSTGGPKILVEILSAFPGNFPAAFVVIQHMDKQFTPGFVGWLDSQINMLARTAVDNDIPEPGTVLIACTDDHLVMTADLTLRYSKEPALAFHRPSIDVFFGSVARFWPAAGIAALLTGMGKDGAEGLLALHKCNWYTISQDRDTSTLYGMPKAAAQINAAKKILPGGKIGKAISDFILAKKSSV